jgi:hypothetical protein
VVTVTAPDFPLPAARAARSARWAARGAGLIGLIALVATVGGCGVPSQHTAKQIEPDQVPFGLLDETPTTDQTVGSTAPMTSQAVVFLVDGDHLAPVVRDVPGGDAPNLIDALLTGPTSDESSNGLRSALADADVVKSTELDGSTAVIDLAPGFPDTPPAEQRVALAQLTFTATEDPRVRAVSFTLDGDPISVPRSDGSSSDGAGCAWHGPVSRSDYATIAPLPGGSGRLSPTTTT